MRVFSIIFLGLFLSACAVKTEIIKSDEGYIVKSKRNALVVVKNSKTGEQYMIDNRGKPWYLELVLSSIIADTKKSVHVELDDLDAVRVEAD